MGRYDNRIKVYKDGEWKTIKNIKVYRNGVWVDLGNNDSDNIRSLYVRKNNENVRVTRNKMETTRTVTTTADYQQRNTNISTVQQYCYTNTGGATNRRFYVKMKVKASGACKLFEFSSAGLFSFYAGIKADGTVWYKIIDNYFVKSSMTNNASKITMGFDAEWQTIEFIGEKGASGANAFKVKVNGTTTSFRLFTAWDARTWRGSSGNVGANNLRICTDGSFVINTADAPFTSLVAETETTTVTDITWV